jgi:hypothetical protein
MKRIRVIKEKLYPKVERESIRSHEKGGRALESMNK